MTDYLKPAIAVVIAAVLTLAIWGAYQYPKAVEYTAASPVGATFGDAKIATITVVPSSAAATSSSILNTDSNDRIITSGFVSCTAVGSAQTQALAGVANWTWQMATTSASAPATLNGTNLAENITVATSTTDDSYSASSTNPALVVYRRWKAGSYLTIQPNATSSTASCVAGVSYLPS